MAYQTVYHYLKGTYLAFKEAYWRYYTHANEHRFIRGVAAYLNKGANIKDLFQEPQIFETRAAETHSG